MAKNWTLKEAAEVIAAGENKEELQEICKRYPLTAVTIAKIGVNEGFATLLTAMPDHVTMLKLERAFKEGVEETEEGDDEEQEEAGGEEKDLSEMTTKQLIALCVKRGIKANKYGKPKAYYIELLEGGSDEADDEEEDEEQEEINYKEMSAVELFKLCKKRGIKTEPKKKVADYVKLLEAADETEAADDEDEEEDWEDEKPTKKAPAASKKTATAKSKAIGKKAAAAAEEEEEDNEDWDI